MYTGKYDGGLNSHRAGQFKPTIGDKKEVKVTTFLNRGKEMRKSMLQQRREQL